MTPELAQMLNGPVAERFGRPRRGDLSLKYDDGWAFLEDDGFLPRGGICSEPAALWLAHLLGVCGEKGWLVAFLPPNPAHSFVAEIAIRRPIGNQILAAETGQTQLQALARAMMAVPQ